MSRVVCCECQTLVDEADAQLVLGDWTCDGCRDTRIQSTLAEVDRRV